MLTTVTYRDKRTLYLHKLILVSCDVLQCWNAKGPPHNSELPRSILTPMFNEEVEKVV